MSGADLSIDSLTPGDTMAAASAATGLDDFGDRGFVEGLRILLDDYRQESRLSAMGIAAQFQNLVRLLSNRLGFQRDLVAHPEIRNERIEKPIIIVGFPRAGTTKLHRMMSADPGVQRMETWRAFFPVPVRGVATADPDPRIAMAEAMQAQMMASFPELMARHAIEAREPDEEIWLMEMSFESPAASILARAPHHRAWVETQPKQRLYSYLRDLLKYLQWQVGGGRESPWILKSPFHIGELPTLLDTFPDATVVYCHRDPREVVPSFASLIEHSRAMYSDRIDLHELGLDMNDFLATQTARNLAARRKIDNERIVDVYYEDIRDRPLEVIARAYARAGHPLMPAAREAFAAYGARRPEGHFGKYSYSQERFGLSAASIEAAFAEYIEQFFVTRK